jgi:uncharacterized protein YqjF (DUF2071 family)
VPRASTPPSVPRLIRQLWRDVGFVHWPVEPAALQRALPSALEIDRHEGMAWVSLTCFSTTCSIGGVLALPGPRRYPETNLRTYVTGPDGRAALWFFSLDVTNRANTILGRLTGLPYHLAEMDVVTGEAMHYVGSRQTGRGTAGYDLQLRPGAACSVGPLDIFLTARWSAYTSLGGTVVRYDVNHQPWPLRNASVLALRESMLDSIGIAGGAPPIAHYAAGVDANLAPRAVHR